jgi:hypothetical protein
VRIDSAGVYQKGDPTAVPNEPLEQTLTRSATAHSNQINLYSFPHLSAAATAR